MDFDKICRLCCEERFRMRTILASEGDYSLAKIFNELLRIEVYPDDGLPQKVCKECARNIVKMFEAVEYYRANDLSLRKHLVGSVEIKEEEEEVDMDSPNVIQQLKIEMLSEPSAAPVKSEYRERQQQRQTPEQEYEDDPTWEFGEGSYQGNDDDDAQSSSSSSSSSDSSDGSVDGDTSDSDASEEIKPKKRGRPRGKSNRGRPRGSYGKRGRRKTKVDNPNRPRKNDHKCYICGSDSLGSAEALVAHLNDHTSEVPYTCPICVMETIVITSVNTLNIHKRMHLNPYKCAHCDRRYSDRNAVDLHVQMHHTGANDPNPMPCSYCGKICPTRLSLRYHERSHQTAVACEICGRLFAEKHKLKQHIRRKHEKIREHECHLCHKNFSSLDSVHTHIRTMHSNNEYKCEYCNRTYTSELSLRYHKKKHENDQNYQATQKWTQYYTVLEPEPGAKEGAQRMKRCNLCGAVVQQIGTHLSNIHFPKEFRCTLCDAVFKRKETYESHVMEHEHGKAFKCPICGKEFSSRKLLICHLKTKQHRDHPLAQSLDWLYTKRERVPKHLQQQQQQQANQPQQQPPLPLPQQLVKQETTVVTSVEHIVYTTPTPTTTTTTPVPEMVERSVPPATMDMFKIGGGSGVVVYPAVVVETHTPNLHSPEIVQIKSDHDMVMHSSEISSI
uniref:Putative c2h2-type zn-finger protein n=1 Tax=Culex tarsalis TaxID=7177 RepID=A0A1Q3F1R7_CULTA